jgi:hypothetical protein
MSILTYFPTPPPDPNYSQVTNDSYIYSRVRLTGDYYMVRMNGSKLVSSLAVGVPLTTVPAIYRPIANATLEQAFIGGAAWNGQTFTATPAGGVTMATNAITAATYIRLTGSWIHKGD